MMANTTAATTPPFERRPEEMGDSEKEGVFTEVEGGDVSSGADVVGAAAKQDRSSRFRRKGSEGIIVVGLSAVALTI